MRFEGKWMELEQKKIIMCDFSQTQEDKYRIFSLTKGS